MTTVSSIPSVPLCQHGWGLAEQVLQKAVLEDGITFPAGDLGRALRGRGADATPGNFQEAVLRTTQRGQGGAWGA